MEELQYPAPLETKIDTTIPNDLAHLGTFTTKNINCMSIKNPYGDIHSSSNLNVNGELFVVEKVTLPNDVYLSSENFTTTIAGNLDVSQLTVDRKTRLSDVIVTGNLLVLGEVNYSRPESNVHIDRETDLQNKSSANCHIIFGKDNNKGSWRLTVIKGCMHVQKHNGIEWESKSIIE